MQKAYAAGLLSGEPRMFARNQLAIVIPKDNPGHIKSAADLGRSGVRVVLDRKAHPTWNLSKRA